jgi:hypothetical protein
MTRWWPCSTSPAQARLAIAAVLVQRFSNAGVAGARPGLHLEHERGAAAGHRAGGVAGAGGEGEGAIRPLRREARLPLRGEHRADAQRREGAEHAGAVVIGDDAQLDPLHAIDEGDGRGERGELGDDQPPFVQLYVDADGDFRPALVRLIVELEG